MKTDNELLEDLKTFADKFLLHNIYSYEDGGYMNGLDFDIDVDDWNNSETLREEFDTWIQDNNLSLPNTQIYVDFENPRIKFFGLVREIK